MKKLSEIATIISGHSFRSSIKENNEGNCFVIQQKNVKKNSTVDWNNLVKTDCYGRKEPNWIQQGDIIFTARGQYNYATFIDDNPSFPTLCSPHFFIIKVDENKFENENFLAPFVAWQINQSLVQAYFEANATGTSMKAVNLSVLKNTVITHMPLEHQEKIIQLHHAHITERDKLQRFLEIREIEMNEISNQLLIKHQVEN